MPTVTIPTAITPTSISPTAIRPTDIRGGGSWFVTVWLITVSKVNLFLLTIIRIKRRICLVICIPSVWSFVLSKRLLSPYLANTATTPTAIVPSHKSATLLSSLPLIPFVLSIRLPSPYFANTAITPTAICTSHVYRTNQFGHHCQCPYWHL